jgi:signal transduction histidine kinase/ActR/RegA family two-component response regulator
MTGSSSLRRKLIIIVAIGSFIIGGISAAGFSWWDLNRFWVRTSAEVDAVANIVADQVGPAVMLSDPKAANEILASLHTDGRIRDVVLYSNKDACFAAFHRESGVSCPPRDPDGIQRHAGAIVISRPVTVGGERVGTLLLVANVPSMGAILRQYLGVATLIVVLSLLVAAVLVVVLQYRVTAPILNIARVAQRMAQTRCFAERVRVHSNDEVGLLANSFNTMLDEIERREADLARHRQRLEQEVTERTRVNAALQQAKEKAEVAARLKSEFLANMSHEIRTPLNGVTGMISLVLDKCSNPEERDQLEAAKGAAMSLTCILNDILDLSKIEAGKMAIESVGFDLLKTLREGLRIFDVAASQKNLRLELDVAPDCPAWVRGDPVRLRQVLINVIGNAVKFTLEGRVDVKVTVPGPGVVRFEVRDTGIGIPREKLEAIFDAFTQADGSHTRRFGGSGLGLAITRRLVTLMRGTLSAESEIGQGSVFSIEVPLAAVPREELSRQAERPSDAAELPTLHVLVAEDNLVNQRVTAGILKRQGWVVTVAVNGEEAFRSFQKDRFDLILMDVQMPELDGLEASTLIRNEEQRRSLARTPIIAVTAHASKAQHEQCFAHGMDGVVTKPLDLATLVDAIRAVLTPTLVRG